MKRLLFLTILFLSSFFLTKNVFAATEFISVIDPDNGSGTDYTSLSAWEAANQVDLTAATTLVIAGSLTRGTIADGTPITQTTSGATAVCVHHTATQMLISTLSGTPDATSTWYPTVDGSDVTNAWTPTTAGDSAIAIAKCRSTAGTADTTAVTVDGWTTSATNYIKIWTDPSDEYGRHDGTVSGSGYVLTNLSNASNITISDLYVVIDGVKILGNAGQAYDSAIRVISGGTANGTVIKNNLIYNWGQNNFNSAIAIEAGSESFEGGEIYNNIIIAKDTPAVRASGGVSVILLYDDFKVYNNTVYGFDSVSNFGLRSGGDASHLKGDVKNNISIGNSVDFITTYSLSADYNISLDSSATGSSSLTSQALSDVDFVSTTSGSEDLHIQETSSAINAGTNISSTFTVDIDNETRLGTWDIGADEAPEKIFRSVGPGVTTVLANGATNPMNISGSTITFTTALADNIGVGDALEYDDDNDGDIDASDSIAFITARTSSTVYTIKTASGATPTIPSAADEIHWNINRAYTSLSLAETGTENTVIDADLRNFDSWSGGKDIAASNEQWNIACYANGTTADTTAVTIDGWMTGEQNYIKIYTPVNSNEVGVSQRHSGVWDVSRYAIEGEQYYGLIRPYESYVRIEGLQVNNIRNPIDGTNAAINFRFISDDTAHFVVANNLITATGIGITDDNNTVSNYVRFDVYNNIIFNTGGGGMMSDPDNNVQFIGVYYNNTIYNSGSDGLVISAYGSDDSVYLKNNLIQNSNPNDYYIEGVVETYIHSNNISFDATSPDGASYQNKTVSFADVANSDFHLASYDTVAKGNGVDLSSDSYLPFSTDIDGDTRTRWDIGADEFGATQSTKFRGDVKTRGDVKIR